MARQGRCAAKPLNTNRESRPLPSTNGCRLQIEVIATDAAKAGHTSRCSLTKSSKHPSPGTMVSTSGNTTYGQVLAAINAVEYPSDSELVPFGGTP